MWFAGASLETRMKNRGRNRLALKFAAFALALGAAALSSASYAQDQQEMRYFSDVQIWKMIIRDSIASYPHACPCPYSANRAGRSCGGRSAYSRVGSLMCYPTDIPDGEVARYRERMQ
jgi:hypothetical protein